MIVVDNVVKTFESTAVLNGVSVRFERGQVSALVGPSGGGKSTLLRCINGLERFDSGRIEVADVTLGPRTEARPTHAEQATLRAIRSKVGMVFQHYGLFAHMTALENVMEAPVHVRKDAPTEARARAEHLLDKVGLTHRRDAYPRELSGGEQQRVAIARALAMDPEVLLLDEPTSALDPARKAEVLRVLRDLAESGATMILVTHEDTVVREIADLAVRLCEGRIASLGKPSDVL